MYRETYSKSEWAIRDNDDAPKDAIGQLLFPLPVALCDDTMKIVITRTGATIIAAFTIAICNRLGTVWDYSTNHLVTFNYQPARWGSLAFVVWIPRTSEESGEKETHSWTLIHIISTACCITSVVIFLNSRKIRRLLRSLNGSRTNHSVPVDAFKSFYKITTYKSFTYYT